MLTTAPMGMVQAAQTPVQAAAANIPQPFTVARFTPVAVMGALPAANPQPQAKPPTPQAPPRTAAQIETANAGVARTPESYLFDVELGEAPPPQTPPQSVPQGFSPSQRLMGGRESLIATQLMMQEDFIAVDLPDTPDITRMIEQAATRRASQAAMGEAAPAVAVKVGHSAILPPTLPSLARPQAIEVMPSHAYTDTGSNAIVRRDAPGTVMQRGQTAYRQASQRLGDYVEPVQGRPQELAGSNQ